ncbi:hypothetical protein M8C21_010272, partial [Ambrosia artemisiifolia]
MYIEVASSCTSIINTDNSIVSCKLMGKIKFSHKQNPSLANREGFGPNSFFKLARESGCCTTTEKMALLL